MRSPFSIIFDWYEHRFHWHLVGTSEYTVVTNDKTTGKETDKFDVICLFRMTRSGRRHYVLISKRGAITDTRDLMIPDMEVWRYGGKFPGNFLPHMSSIKDIVLRLVDMEIDKHA